MESHQFSRHQWELESQKQVYSSHRHETGSTSEVDDIKSVYSGRLALPASGHRTPSSVAEERKETARISELGPRLAGYLEMNPLFLVRRDDYGNTARAGSPEVVIIPLSPDSLNSPRPDRRASCCQWRKRAVVVPAFVLANVIVFIITMYRNNCPAHQTQYRCILPGLKRFSFQPLTQNPLLGPSSETLLSMGALESELVTTGRQGWRVVTCIWLHAGVFHLLLNMLGLLTLGLQMEQEFGFFKLGVIYLLSGFGGSLLSALFLRLTISVGASGALFGLMGALLSELLINWSHHERNWFMLSQLVVLLIINLALGKMPHVDNYAHLGGCIGGFLLGFVLLQKPHFTWSSDRSPTSTGSPAHGIPAHEFTATAPAIASQYDYNHQLVQFDNRNHHQHQYSLQRQQRLSQERPSQERQPWRISTCMVSLPRYKFVIWILALNLFVVLYVVAIIMLFRGVDVRKKCKWCRQLL